MTVTIGIDPGIRGAIACFVDGELLDVEDMPTFTEKRGKRNVTTIAPTGVVSILRDFARAGFDDSPTVVIERVHSMPGNAAAAMFNFGHGFGIVHAVPLALGMSVRFVEPRIWKKAAGLTADKGGALRLAAERWPSHAALFARVKDDGRAEAALIGAWGVET